MVDHEEVQAALSARLDGEPADVDDDVIDAHVAGCGECRAFWEKSVTLSRRLSVVDSPRHGMSPPADLSEVIIAGVEPEWRRRAAGRMASLALSRTLLGVLGVVMVVWAALIVSDAGGMVPVSSDGMVLDPTAQPETAALMIETAALRLAVGVGLFFAAWRPQLVAGTLPIVATLWTFLTGFTMRDILLGGAETEQILWLLSLLLAVVALLWAWLAGRGADLRAAWRALTADPN
ncbi:zf-HC2 domain-containing protein [Corynebacterium guangdongense]|uniref:Anti-sigma-YlaC factor YlaD n=1 Tax=Corynebacterium guangdongense TaxID=1783348 RepID=A0ABU1ZV97_9CORY|nr:zf-HC2 domain-containing protein [Corynebacterium guangdongense]MDR7328849.1 putative anti-sigma-YlaC factor YlaD [Corynebacterium guangdongense]WJZ17424.1 hypothetical protein CGUA_04170 [Corynebacterium guangdongense]